MKNKSYNFGKHLIIILTEMCKRVGTDFNKINFKKERWFMEYSWTQEQEDDFTNWFSEYLYKNKEARQEFLSYPIKDKKRCIQAAKEFVFNYGWTTYFPEQV